MKIYFFIIFYLGFINLAATQTLVSDECNIAGCLQCTTVDNTSLCTQCQTDIEGINPEVQAGKCVCLTKDQEIVDGKCDYKYHIFSQVEDYFDTGMVYSYRNDGDGAYVPKNGCTLGTSNGCGMKTDCICNLTFNKCDERCCCDPDCGAEIVEGWTQENACISTNLNVKCISDVTIFNINLYRGMQLIEDTVNQQQCIYSDNQIEYSEYQKDNTVEEAESLTIPSLLLQEKYIEAYTNFETPSLQTDKLTGNVINNLRIYQPNSFGECKLNRYIQYNIDIPTQSCVFTLNKANMENQCLSGQLNLNTQLHNYFQADTVYFINDAGDISVAASSTQSFDGNDFTCNNAVKGVIYYSTINSNLEVLSSIAYVWLQTISNPFQNNAETYSHKQFFGSYFIRQFNSGSSYPLIHSGAPGYFKGYRVPVLINSNQDLHFKEQIIKDNVFLELKQIVNYIILKQCLFQNFQRI